MVAFSLINVPVKYNCQQPVIIIEIGDCTQFTLADSAHAITPLYYYIIMEAMKADWVSNYAYYGQKIVCIINCSS